MDGKQLLKGKGITKTTLCTRMELRFLMKLFSSQNQQQERKEHSGITHHISNKESRMEKFATITDTDHQREISEALLLLDVPEIKMHFQHSPVCLF